MNFEVARVLAALADVSGETAGLEELRREADRFDPAASTAAILYELLAAEEDEDELARTAESADRLFGEFVAAGDLESAARLRLALRAAAREQEPGSARAEILAAAVRRTRPER